VELVAVPGGAGVLDFIDSLHVYSIKEHTDLRYFANVLYYANEDPRYPNLNGVPRGALTGSYFPGGTLNLVAGKRLWVPSPSYALTFQNIVGTGSYTGNVQVGIDRIQAALPDILQSIRESLANMPIVAGEEWKLIQEHKDESIGTMLVFAGAELASALLTSTGVGAPAALVINALLTLFGLYGVVTALGSAIQMAIQWLILAMDAHGDPAKITAESQAFDVMVIALALAILAAIGTAKAAGKTIAIASKLGGVNAAAVVAATESATDVAATAAADTTDPAAADIADPAAADAADPATTKPADAATTDPNGKLTDPGTPKPGSPIRIRIGSAIIVEIMADSDQADAIQFIKGKMNWQLPNDTVWQIHFESEGNIPKSAAVNTFTLMKMGIQDMLELYNELSSLGDKAPGILWSTTNDTMFNIAKSFGFQQVQAFEGGFMIVAAKTADLLNFIQAHFDQLSRIAGK